MPKNAENGLQMTYYGRVSNIRKNDWRIFGFFGSPPIFTGFPLISFGFLSRIDREPLVPDASDGRSLRKLKENQRKSFKN